MKYNYKLPMKLKHDGYTGNALLKSDGSFEGAIFDPSGQEIMTFSGGTSSDDSARVDEVFRDSIALYKRSLWITPQ